MSEENNNESTNDTRSTRNDANSVSGNNTNTPQGERPVKSAGASAGQQPDLFTWARRQTADKIRRDDELSQTNRTGNDRNRNSDSSPNADISADRSAERSAVNREGVSNNGDIRANSGRGITPQSNTGIRASADDGALQAFLRKAEINPDSEIRFDLYINRITDESESLLEKMRDSNLKRQAKESLEVIQDLALSTDHFTNKIRFELVKLDLRFNQALSGQKIDITQICKEFLPIEFNETQPNKKDLHGYLNKKLTDALNKLKEEVDLEKPEQQLRELGAVRGRIALLKRFYHENNSLPEGWFHSSAVPDKSIPDEINPIHTLVQGLNAREIPILKRTGLVEDNSYTAKSTLTLVEETFLSDVLKNPSKSKEDDLFYARSLLQKKGIVNPTDSDYADWKSNMDSITEAIKTTNDTKNVPELTVEEESRLKADTWLNDALKDPEILPVDDLIRAQGLLSKRIGSLDLEKTSEARHDSLNAELSNFRRLIKEHETARRQRDILSFKSAKDMLDSPSLISVPNLLQDAKENWKEALEKSDLASEHYLFNDNTVMISNEAGKYLEDNGVVGKGWESLKEPIEFPTEKKPEPISDLAQFDKGKVPPEYTSVIIATQDENTSRSIEDYYGHRTLRSVVVGFSKTDRMSFAEIRKAGKKSSIKEIRDVAALGKDKEHRENYSMGAGYYLKDGHDNADGWSLRKTEIKYLYQDDELEFDQLAFSTPVIKKEKSNPPGELSLKPEDNADDTVKIIETTHTQKGHDLFVIQLTERVDKDEFKSILADAKSLKGYYSKFSRDGAVPGFQFKSREAAVSFIEILSPKTVEEAKLGDIEPEENEVVLDEYGVDWTAVNVMKSNIAEEAEIAEIEPEEIPVAQDTKIIDPIDYDELPSLTPSQEHELYSEVSNYHLKKQLVENYRPDDKIRLRARGVAKPTGRKATAIKNSLDKLLAGDLDKNSARKFYLKSVPYKLLILDKIIKTKNLDQSLLADILTPNEKHHIGDNLLILDTYFKGNFRKVMSKTPDDIFKLLSGVEDPDKLQKIASDLSHFIDVRLDGEGEDPEVLSREVGDKIHIICRSENVFNYKNISSAEVFSSHAVSLSSPDKVVEIKEIPELAPITPTPPTETIDELAGRFQQWVDLRNSGEFPVGDNVTKATLVTWIKINHNNWSIHTNKIHDAWIQLNNDPEPKTEIELGKEFYEKHKDLIIETDKGLDLSQFNSAIAGEALTIEETKTYQNGRTRASLYAHGFQDRDLFIDANGWVEADMRDLEQIDMPSYKQGYVASNRVTTREYANGFGSAFSVSFDNGGGGHAPKSHNSFLFKTKELAIQAACDEMQKSYSKSDSPEAKFYEKEVAKVKNSQGGYLGDLFEQKNDQELNSNNISAEIEIPISAPLGQVPENVIEELATRFAKTEKPLVKLQEWLFENHKSWLVHSKWIEGKVDGRIKDFPSEVPKTTAATIQDDFEKAQNKSTPKDGPEVLPDIEAQQKTLERQTKEALSTGMTVNRSFNSLTEDERAVQIEEFSKTIESQEFVSNKTTQDLFTLKGKDFIPRGLITRTQANIEAIKTLKIIESENRSATNEEKEVLAKYIGWGGIKNVFKIQGVPDNLKKYSEELKEILTDEEWESAASSVLNAHYTSPEIIQEMWKSAENMNFKGGDILEPACGTGYFIGLCPEHIRKNSKFTAVECDSLSARLTKQLYPEITVLETTLEKAPLVNAQFDLVIGNVPFLETNHLDINYPRMHLHDYFLNKSVDLVRPGGIVQEITTKASMDSSFSVNSRKALGRKSLLLSGVRLPWDAFKGNAGADVTTDILTFQRKKDINQLTLNHFAASSEETIENRNKSVLEVKMNEYYHNNPEMLLGNLEETRGRYSDRREINLIADEFKPEMISEAMYKKHSPFSFDAIKSDNPGWADTTIELQADSDYAHEKNYAFLVKEGIVYQKIDHKLLAHDKANKSYKTIERSQSFIELRDKLKDVVAAQIDPTKSDKEVEGIRLDMVKEFDQFEKEWGSPWSRTNKNLFYSDPEYPLVLSLQKEEIDFDENKKKIVSYKRLGLLKERTCFPLVEPSVADSIHDAANLSMFYKGSIDAEYIASLLKTDVPNAESLLYSNDLAYKDPDTAELLDRETYLSGNVRVKLAQAELAVSKSGTDEFKRNVEQLSKIQPERIDIDKIDVQINSTWISPEIVTDFIKNITDSRSDLSGINYNSVDGKWNITSLPYNEEFKTSRVKFESIVSCALNMKSPKVEDSYFEGGKEYKKANEQETLAAIQKINDLKEKFLDHLYSDKSLCEKVEESYNLKFNSHKKKEFSTYGISHYPGANKSITPREYQVRAINRAVHQKTLLAHAVGAGKTVEMITAGQEKKRLGLAHKNMIVVQNSTVAGFAAEYKHLYPNSNILVPLHEKEYRAGNRKLFLSRIASNNWDAVIIPHSFFDLIKDDPEIVKGYYRETKSEYRMAATMAGNKQRDIEKALKKIDLEMEQYLGDKTDDTLTFKELGVDCLMIDEVHAFKKIGIATKMDAIKGLDTSSSKKARKLMMKIRAVKAVAPNNIITATGTPVTNTLAELHSQMRIVNEEILEERGVKRFDDFAATFTLPTDEVELTATQKLKMVKRLSSFTNVGTLVGMFSECADVMTSKTLNTLGCVSKPNIIGGNSESVLIEQSPAIGSIMDGLQKQLEDFQNMSGAKKRENRHIPLLVFGRARQVAVDPRILTGNNPQFDYPSSKANTVVDSILDIHAESAEDDGAQMVFSDIFRSSDKSFNLFEDMKEKLIAKGIPEEQIAIIHDYKTNASREKLFSDVNSGKVRVLFGTTEKMGVGVNAQERLKALHHMDAPWMPSQLEQRNGRILRHGNIFADKGGVYIKQYGVEKTMDAVIYQRLLQKQKFIESILDGDINDVKVEDAAGELTISAEEATAIFSGNPGMIEKFKLEKEIDQLNKVQRSWHSQIVSTKQSIPKVTEQIEQLNEKITDMDKVDISDIENWEGGKKEYSVKFGSNSYSAKASELLNQPMGEIRFNCIKKGFDLELRDSVYVNDIEFKLRGSFDDREGGLGTAKLIHVNTGLELTSPSGNSATLVNNISELKDDFADSQIKRRSSLAAQKKKLKSMADFIEIPWKKEAEYKEKREELLALIDVEESHAIKQSSTDVDIDIEVKPKHKFSEIKIVKEQKRDKAASLNLKKQLK